MRLVIVEDSKLIRDQLIQLLARQPRFTVIGTAAEEAEAVQLILATHPDTVILDLSLAPGSGIQVLKKIRAAHCGARVLVLTNNTGEPLRQACKQLGAHSFYDKNFELNSCLEQLNSWLPALPGNETRRLELLYGTHLLDTREQEVFDNLTHLAAEIADTPIALLSLVDTDRQWFLSHTGTTERETSRSIAFCAHAILHNETMVVEDALEDPRFQDNPLVKGETNIRFYAGVPLVLASGEALGTLCVIDHKPRQLTETQQHALKTLASSAVAEIELRRRIVYLEQESERRRVAETHILHLATRDPLTALPNRATFRDRLEHHVRYALRRNAGLGVLFIDLDRFKPINDTLGHDVGDEALVIVAERLNHCLRNSDTVARIGGDEFAVVLPDVSGSAEVLQVAEKIIAALEEPMLAKGHKLHLGSSIGVALFPDHGQLGDQLLRHADLAMYQAKQSGGHRACLYAQWLSDQAEEMQTLDNDLREGMKRGELLLHYQAQTTLEAGKLSGVEALVRWKHPRFGLLLPDHFIPLAEQRGIIHELTRRVLDMALGQLAQWDARGLCIPKVAINISPSDIRPGFTEMVEAALVEHNLKPQRLELEITESTLTTDGVEIMHMLNHLRNRGISIAIDDFGIGYSSLAQLHRLPIDFLKIDRTFIQDLESSSSSRAIVRAIITMANALGLRSIAEGVEREEQVGLLESFGCPCGQGYFISKPLPAVEAETWMRNLLATEDMS